MTTAQFRRARRPEQVEARRAAILDAAGAMLTERPVAEISLRELAERVGLAKSNVLRYFDSREAIFLEVLERAWTDWLDRLELPATRSRARHAREAAVGRAIAEALVAAPLLCELLSVMGGVLERNISLDFARDFKRGATASTQRLAALVRARIPELSEEGATHFAGVTVILVSGLWPYANPTPAVARAAEELGAPCAADMFAQGLAEALVNQLVGLVTRG